MTCTVTPKCKVNSAQGSIVIVSAIIYSRKETGIQKYKKYGQVHYCYTNNQRTMESLTYLAL